MRRPTQPHDQLEDELQRLLEFQERGEVSDGGEVPANGEDVRKRVRVIKNRLAAKKSREQARSYVQELEEAMKALESKNQDLARRLALVEAENATLKRGNASNPKSGKVVSNSVTKGTKNHLGEPAELPTTSLQLDVVLVSMVLMAAQLHAQKSEPNAVLRTPVSPPQELVGRPPALIRGLPRSTKSLRRAGMLQCIAHSGHRIPAVAVC